MLAVGAVGVLGFQQVFKPIAVSAATSVRQVVRNTLVTPVRDPFYPDYYQRVFVFPTEFAGWWFGDDYAKGFQKITFTSLDPSTQEKVKEFLIAGYTSREAGFQMGVLTGHTPDSCYSGNGNATTSDDYNLFFPATPSGELTSPVRLQAEGGIDRVVFVPARWWEPMQ